MHRSEVYLSLMFVCLFVTSVAASIIRMLLEIFNEIQAEDPFKAVDSAP